MTVTVPLSYTEQKSVIEGLEAVNAKQRLELSDAALAQVDLEGQVFDLKERVKELEAERGAFECNEQSFVAEIHRLRDALETRDRRDSAQDGSVHNLHANIGRLERQVSALRLGIRAALFVLAALGATPDSCLEQDLRALLRETP